MRETTYEPSCLSPSRGPEQSRVNVKRMIHDIVPGYHKENADPLRQNRALVRARLFR